MGNLDFFADAADMLAEGDMMMVSAPDGGRILTIAVGDRGRGRHRAARLNLNRAAPAA